MRIIQKLCKRTTYFSHTFHSKYENNILTKLEIFSDSLTGSYVFGVFEIRCN